MDAKGWAEIVMMLFIGGLGLKEVLAQWQAYQQKRGEKLLDHELAGEAKAINYIIEQSEKYRLQVEDLQNNKFAQMREDMAKIVDQMAPCANLLKELLVNREKTEKLSHEILMSNQTQNEILKLIVGKLRIDMRKMDTSGQLDDIITAALTDTGNHKRPREHSEQWRSGDNE